MAYRGQCKHFGDRVGTLSCGCGDVFRCAFDDSLCVIRKPFDPLVTVTIGDAKSESAGSFRACLECDHAEYQSRFAPRAKNDLPTVGFIAAAYCRIGGTETFHQTLLPRLSRVRPAGFVATAFAGGDPRKLGPVPFGVGLDAARELAQSCDVVVSWGIDNLIELLPVERPAVVVVHHGGPESSWSNQLIASQWESWDRAVCVSEVAADVVRSAVRDVSLYPVDVIPNAVDPIRYMPTSDPEYGRVIYGLDKGRNYVLWAARMSPEKRVRVAIEAAKRLPDGWQMVFCGEGQELGAVTRESDHRIRYIGSPEYLGDLFAVSSVFLSTAEMEGFGLSMAEAMAAGVPVAATQRGIASEPISELIDERCSADDVVDAIMRASRREKVDAAMRHTLQEWSVDTFVDRWETAILNTLATHQKR